MNYDLFIDEQSDEDDIDFNDVFLIDDESDDEIVEKVVSFTLEINDRSKIEINYITLISESESDEE